MKEWELLKPHHNPPNNKPGWYFLYLTRADKLASAGPYDTEEFCQRVIDTGRPCGHTGCSGTAFNDDFSAVALEQIAAGDAAGGVSLCKHCERDFVKWHKKKRGRKPREAGVQ